MFTNALYTKYVPNTSRNLPLYIKTNFVIFLSNGHLLRPSVLLSSYFLAALSPNCWHLWLCAHPSSPLAGLQGPNSSRELMLKVYERVLKTLPLKYTEHVMPKHTVNW